MAKMLTPIDEYIRLMNLWYACLFDIDVIGWLTGKYPKKEEKCALGLAI